MGVHAPMLAFSGHTGFNALPSTGRWRQILETGNGGLTGATVMGILYNHELLLV